MFLAFANLNAQDLIDNLRRYTRKAEGPLTKNTDTATQGGRAVATGRFSRPQRSPNRRWGGRRRSSTPSSSSSCCTAAAGSSPPKSARSAWIGARRPPPPSALPSPTCSPASSAPTRTKPLRYAHHPNPSSPLSSRARDVGPAAARWVQRDAVGEGRRDPMLMREIGFGTLLA